MIIKSFAFSVGLSPSGVFLATPGFACVYKRLCAKGKLTGAYCMTCAESFIGSIVRNKWKTKYKRRRKAIFLEAFPLAACSQMKTNSIVCFSGAAQTTDREGDRYQTPA